MAKVAILVIIAIAVVWAIFWGSKKPKTEAEMVPATPSAQVAPVEPISIKLVEQNKSGETGVVDISPVEGKTKVMITITGKKSTVPQPAHIHGGMCPKPDAIKYALSDVVGGLSETILDVSMEDLLKQGQLAVNVHKSAAEAAVYVSCGDITR